MNVTVHYELHEGACTLVAYTEVENISAEALGLEYVSSFVYAGLDDGEAPVTAQDICVGVPHNATFSENHWQFYTIIHIPPFFGRDTIKNSSQRCSLRRVKFKIYTRGTTQIAV